MARGGDRIPSKPASYSGVGKNSRRTDGQPIRSPNVQDSTDLTQGDRRVIEQGQRMQPLSNSQPSPSAPTQGSLQQAQRSSDLGSHIFDIPTTREGEPPTEGMPFGPGAGPEALMTNQMPDDKMQILDFLARGGNNDAVQRIRSGMLDSQRPTPPQPEPRLSLAPEPEMEPSENAPMQDAPMTVSPDEVTEVPQDEAAEPSPDVEVPV